MNRRFRTCLAAMTAAVALPAAMLATAAPASATVHEIVAQWCSGHDELGPPGLSGGSNADNVARPLAASGVLGDPVPFMDGLLIPLDTQAKNLKVVGTGVFVQIAQNPNIYIELVQADPNFPAFRHCPRLVTG